MLKILIVEDDKLYRQELAVKVNWEKYGFCLSGQAINGVQALQMIEKEIPDVVLTDISMPGMNGIELIRIISEKYPSIHIVILSSYDDFHFIKDAMKYHAEDYLLKYEMQETDLISILRNLRQKIEEERDKQRKKKFIEEQQYRIFHEMLRGYIKGEDINWDMMMTGARLLGVSEMGSSFGIAVIKLYDRAQKIDFMNRETLMFPDQNILLKIDRFEYAYVMIFSREKSQSRIYEAVYQEVARIKMQLEKTGTQSFSIGVSEINEGWDKLPSAHMQAVLAADQKFFRGYGKILYYRELKRGKQQDFSDDIEQFGECLREHNFERCNATCENILRDMEYSSLGEQEIQNVLVQLYNTIYKVCVKEKISFERVVENSETVLAMAAALDTKDKARKNITDYIKRIRQMTDIPVAVLPTDHMKEVSWIKQYIDRNYMNDINLNILAEELHMTPSYVCKIFRKGTGKKLTEYLNMVRIDHAKRLIKTTNLKVYEISEKVGFTRESYFCTVFKNITGEKISDYKNRI